jgi:hypothetical protein
VPVGLAVVVPGDGRSETVALVAVVVVPLARPDVVGTLVAGRGTEAVELEAPATDI